MRRGVSRLDDPAGPGTRSALRELPRSVLAICGHPLRAGGRGSAEGHREMKDAGALAPEGAGLRPRWFYGVAYWNTNVIVEPLGTSYQSHCSANESASVPVTVYVAVPAGS